MAGPCQVLTCHNTRNVVLMLLVLSMVCHIKPCWRRAMPRRALPMPCPITSCHFVPCNVSLAVGVCWAPSQCNANQQMPLARETSTTEHSTLVVAPCHINQTHSRNTPVPDISVCCSFLDRSKRATLNTVKNTRMSTLHIRSLLLPSPEAHARVLAQLMTTCHNRRLQRFCERHGASDLHSVVRDIQFSEGAVCLEFWKTGSTSPSAREGLHAIPSFKSGAPPVSAHSHERENTCSARSCRAVSREVLSYWALCRHVNACDGNCEEGAQQ